MFKAGKSEPHVTMKLKKTVLFHSSRENGSILYRASIR